MDLKILAWNVKHFKGPRRNWQALSNNQKDADQAARVRRVANEIGQIDPDIFAILEVSGDNSPYALADEMPGYSFLLTEGRQSQEILIGFRTDMRLFFTQKGEFKENNLSLRPAPVLDLKTPSGRNLTLLFAHFKSMTSPDGWGLRTSMFEKLGDLKKSLDDWAQSNGEPSAAFVAMGDFNTMGMNLTDSNGDISGPEEIERIEKRMRRWNMRHPNKSAPNTFVAPLGASYGDSDLDHVYLDESLTIKPENGHEVRVGGWTELQGDTARQNWAEEYSDHAPLWFTLTGL